MGGGKLTPALQARAIELALEGAPLKRIAALLGVTHPALSNHLARDTAFGESLARARAVWTHETQKKIADPHTEGRNAGHLAWLLERLRASEFRPPKTRSEVKSRVESVTADPQTPTEWEARAKEHEQAAEWCRKKARGE